MPWHHWSHCLLDVADEFLLLVCETIVIGVRDDNRAGVQGKGNKGQQAWPWVFFLNQLAIESMGTETFDSCEPRS